MAGCPTSSTKPGGMSHIFGNHGGMSHIFNKTRWDVSCLQQNQVGCPMSSTEPGRMSHVFNKTRWNVPWLQQNQAGCPTFQKPHTFFITFLQTLHETAPNIFYTNTEQNFQWMPLTRQKANLNQKKTKKILQVIKIGAHVNGNKQLLRPQKGNFLCFTLIFTCSTHYNIKAYISNMY
jgi:hypothetical protein